MNPQFYKEYYDFEKNHWWFLVRQKIILKFIEKYFGKPAGQKIFDAGCGSGYFVNMLQKLGYDVCGADIFAPAVEYGIQQGIKNISVMEGDKFNIQDGVLDGILLLDVLEHLKDETRLLNEVFRVLKPGSASIITVPAYMFLWGLQDEVAHHFRRYTRSNLLKRIEAAGFQITYSSYYNTLLFLPIALVRIFCRITGIRPKVNSDFEINSSLVNSVLYNIFILEAVLLKWIRFPFGVSIVVVAKKI